MSKGKNVLSQINSKMKDKLDSSIKSKAYHTLRALQESKRNGGIKSVQKSKNGKMYNYRNGTGYYIDN